MGVSIGRVVFSKISCKSEIIGRALPVRLYFIGREETTSLSPFGAGSAPEGIRKIEN